MPDWWYAANAFTQESHKLLITLLPVMLLGWLILRGYRPLTLLRSLLWRFRLANVVFIILLAVSVGLGVALVAQERGLRSGTAKAADKFELVVTAPGSDINAMLATVYLQPSDMPLLSGAVMSELDQHPEIVMAAPLAFGDNYEGAPIVGTTTALAKHIGLGKPGQEIFLELNEAVAGYSTTLRIGDSFEPAHGLHNFADSAVHSDHDFTVVARLKPTGTPWDHAILIPIEALWQVHGLAKGHAAGWQGVPGPPFDAERFPGTPAVVIKARTLAANYSLRDDFTRSDTMAFFPATVLNRLYSVVGNVRELMSVLVMITQLLVAISIFASLIILTRLFSRQLALLRGLGAPTRFVFALVWCYASVLLICGTLVGALTGYVASKVIASVLSAHTQLQISSTLGWPEIQLLAIFLGLTHLVALLPAYIATRRSPLLDLRS